MKQFSTLLVLSALADGTILTGFLKALASAGFPATAADLGGLLAAVLVALYSRWSNARKLDRHVQQAVAKHLRGEKKPARAYQGLAPKVRRILAKSKKTNV